MGFELGPGLLRRAPRGWLPARAYPLKHHVGSHHHGEGGAPDIELSSGMKVLWRVEVPGREVYEVDEYRSVPNWLDPGAIAASGNRWYKVRIRPTFGLMPKVGVPCVVNPKDPSELWIDWDAAYEEHKPAWEQEARVRLEVARREGKLDGAIERITNPFAGKLRAGESELADQRMAEEAHRAAEVREHYAALARGEMAKRGIEPVTENEAAEQKRRMVELTRIQQTGRKTRAKVVSVQATSEKLANVAKILLTFDVEGRPVVFEHVYGPMHLRHYKVGREVDVWVDPENPDAICPGR